METACCMYVVPAACCTPPTRGVRAYVQYDIFTSYPSCPNTPALQYNPIVNVHIKPTYLGDDARPRPLGDRLFRVRRRELRRLLLRYLHDDEVQRALLDDRPGEARHDGMLEHVAVDAQGAPEGAAVALWKDTKVLAAK